MPESFFGDGRPVRFRGHMYIYSGRIHIQVVQLFMEHFYLLVPVTGTETGLMIARMDGKRIPMDRISSYFE